MQHCIAQDEAEKRGSERVVVGQADSAFQEERGEVFDEERGGQPIFHAVEPNGGDETKAADQGLLPAANLRPPFTTPR